MPHRRKVAVLGRAEYLGGTTIKFICPKGHTQIEDMNRGSLKTSKRVGESGTRMLVQHWQYTGVTFDCKGCTKERPKDV